MLNNFRPTYINYNGVDPESLGSEQSLTINEYFRSGIRGGIRFLSEDEIVHLGTHAVKKSIRENISKEKQINYQLNILTTAFDRFMEELISHNLQQRGEYVPFVRSMDRRIIGRGTEEMYVFTRTGERLWYVSHDRIGEAEIPKNLTTSTAVMTFNSIDAKSHVPIDYVVSAVNSGITEVRMVVPEYLFHGYEQPSAIHRIRTHGVDIESIRNTFFNTHLQLRSDMYTETKNLFMTDNPLTEDALSNEINQILEERVHKLQTNAWAQTARKLHFEYDIIPMGLTPKAIEKLQYKPIKLKHAEDIAQDYYLHSIE